MSENTNTAKGQEAAAAKGKGQFSTLREKQTVYSTDLDKHHETGTAFSVHPVVAKRLIENGLATSEPVEGTEKKKRGGKKAEGEE